METWDWKALETANPTARKEASVLYAQAKDFLKRGLGQDIDAHVGHLDDDFLSAAIGSAQTNGARGFAIASMQPGTKDRRDAFRRQIDAVVGYSNAAASHAQKTRMEVIVNTTVDDDDFWPFAFRTYTGGSAITAAQLRNRLTMSSLALVALGVVNVDWLYQMAERGDDSGDINEAVDSMFSCTIEEMGEVTKNLVAVEEIFKANGLGSTAAAASTAGTTTATTDDETETSSMETAAVAAAPTAAEKAVMATIDAGTFKKVDATVKALIDANMKAVGLPTVNEIGEALEMMADKVSKADSGIKITIGKGMAYEPSKGGALPKGDCVLQNAAKLFGLTGTAAKPFEFEVPCYEWDGDHPFVPEIDPAYQFNPKQLLNILTAILTNQRAYLYGDTGCGKTTLIEQIAARLNYPVIRVNFDSEITRMDLIGAKDIVVSSGHPVTVFTEGVLPQAMQQPCIMLCDELDFIRADVAYVFQRALEGKGLTLPEDGGRVIVPHAGFRIIATGNTQGNGDETGRYQGAKPQSAAFLDRFTMWIKCDYMSHPEVERLLNTKYPKLGKAATTLANYAREHWVAFKNGEVLTALSPRGLLACAMTYTIYRPLMDEKQALKNAMDVTFVERASKEDAQTINGLISRVAK